MIFKKKDRNRRVEVVIFQGDVGLEVVGESRYQTELRTIVDRVGRDVLAVLTPEPTNPYDPNAVAVMVNGVLVGYLPREIAPDFQPAVMRLQQRENLPIALRGRIVGGEPDRPSLGIWLDHDPTDFGLPAPKQGYEGEVRTGAGDQGGDWYSQVPSDNLKAIKKLRELLSETTDPVDRHFMHNQLEEGLYRARDTFTSALDEYDEAVKSHDSEMETIRPALLGAFDGTIPVLPLYRQMCIRQQKAGNFAEALQWAERGLEVYGSEAHRPEDTVEDLEKRAAHYRTKIP
jgi:hypothetical protein